MLNETLDQMRVFSSNGCEHNILEPITQEIWVAHRAKTRKIEGAQIAPLLLLKLSGDFSHRYVVSKPPLDTQSLARWFRYLV